MDAWERQQHSLIWQVDAWERQQHYHWRPPNFLQHLLQRRQQPSDDGKPSHSTRRIRFTSHIRRGGSTAQNDPAAGAEGSVKDRWMGSGVILLPAGGDEVGLRSVLASAGEDPREGADVLLVEPADLASGAIDSEVVELQRPGSQAEPGSGGAAGALCGFADRALADRFAAAAPLLRFTRMFCFSEGVAAGVVHGAPCCTAHSL